MTAKQSFAIYCKTGVDVRACNLSQIQIDEIFQGKLNAASLPGAIVKRQVTQKQDFASIYAEAHQAGMLAASNHTPTPMIVSQRSNPLDDNSPIDKSWYIPQGVCGFYSVIIKPATSGFVKWLKNNNLGGYKHYYGGYNFPCHEFGQSYELKGKYCTAFADVLNKYGINAYSDGRLD